MARETITKLIDDIDGGEAHHTVRFGLDGREYEIDLSDKNANKLRNALAPYVEHATEIRERRGGTSRRSSPRPASSASQNKAIREWAQKKGYQVAERGRIPVDVVAAFEKAHAK